MTHPQHVCQMVEVLEAALERGYKHALACEIHVTVAGRHDACSIFAARLSDALSAANSAQARTLVAAFAEDVYTRAPKMVADVQRELYIENAHAAAEADVDSDGDGFIMGMTRADYEDFDARR